MGEYIVYKYSTALVLKEWFFSYPTGTIDITWALLRNTNIGSHPIPTYSQILGLCLLFLTSSPHGSVVY